MFTQNYSKPQTCSFRNLKLKTQILIICLIFCTFILGLQIAIIFIGENILKGALQDKSDEIFYKQTQSFINSIWINKQSMEEVVEQTKHQINVVRKLYQFVEIVDHFKIEKPIMCLNNQNESDEYCHTESTCCGIFGETNELSADLNFIMMTSSLLNVFRLEFDFNKYSPLYYTYNNSAEYYCKSWSINLDSSFHPFQRPYYIEHLKYIETSPHTEECFFASPYKAMVNQIRSPMTTSILNINQEFKGVIAKDLDFNYSSINQSPNKITSYVINQSGLVIFTEKYRLTSQPQFYLSEFQYSGFNSFDQQQIMAKHYGKAFQNNCSNFQSQDILCLYNSDLNESVIVQTANITNSPYILISFLQINYIQFEQNQYLQLLTTKINEIIDNYLILILTTSLGIIITDQLFIPIFLRQLYHLKEDIEYQMISSQFIFSQCQYQHIFNLLKENLMNKMSIYSMFASDSVKNLVKCVVERYRNIFNIKKNDECKYQEDLNYPKINWFDLKYFIIVKYAMRRVQNKASLSINSLPNIQ